MAESDIQDAITSHAQGFDKVVTPEATTERPSLPDQIEADRYLTAKRNLVRTNKGVIFNTIKPPGAV
jgi:hypothetical protein